MTLSVKDSSLTVMKQVNRGRIREGAIIWGERGEGGEIIYGIS